MNLFKINPEFSQRLNFHRSRQPGGQDMSKWADDLDGMAGQCDVINMSEDDTFVTKYIAGVTDNDMDGQSDQSINEKAV